MAALGNLDILTHDNIRIKLLQRLTGSSVDIPDLWHLISHWPQGAHKEIERLDKDIQRVLADLFSSPTDEGRLRRMKDSNFALFGGLWWAYAPFEALRTATYLCIWRADILLDLETDSLEFSDVSNDANAAAEFRHETTTYLQGTLSGKSEIDLSHISTNPIVTSFRPIGEAILESCNTRQISALLSELLFYVKMCGEEQRYKTTPYLPTIEEYNRIREGSSAVRVCLAGIEYAHGIDLPEEIMNNRKMEQIWHETTIIISTINDMLSIKKEVAQSQLDTLIPLLMLESRSIQDAVDHAANILSASIKRFESAEEEILAQYSTMPNAHEDLRKFLEGCKYACTANIKWSITTERYQLGYQSMQGGIHIAL
ncbi:terpenoid synthase [Daldinia grandis]|nr:terpenoid synthase [Daldinia grandis]